VTVNARTFEVLQEISIERRKQDAKWGEQNHPIVSHLQAPGLGEQHARACAEDRAEYWKYENDRRAAHGMLSWDGVLLEETYEALAEEDEQKVRAEMVQVAAVAVAIIECIDRRAARAAA
jgi:hypothetical protein